MRSSPPVRPPADSRTSYRIADDPEQVAQERARLAHLTDHADAGTFRTLEELGIAPGWRCLEVGAGSGTVARWMAERVAPSGSVVSVDVDVRFQPEGAPNLEVRALDVTSASLGEDEFDLVHARALLQHLHQREAVLDRMVAAARPGGLVVLQDADFTSYELQEIPEPFGTLSRRSIRGHAASSGWDPYCGRWLLSALKRRGLRDCDARGRVWTMHGGTSSAEWYVGGIARARESALASGAIPAELFDRAIAQARDPDFAILSPTAICAWGRKPGG